MNDANIKRECQKIASDIKKLHDRLMDIYFSIENEDEKKKYQHLLGAAGRLYKALAMLRD